MGNNALQTSLRMALIMGIFLPLAETVRRIKQLTDLKQFFFWFDDYILGGTLLVAAYLLKKKHPSGPLYLIAAWAFVAGALFLSLLAQVDMLMQNQSDHGVFSAGFIFVAKALILLYLLLGLRFALKGAQVN